MELAEGATRHPRSEDHALPSIGPWPGRYLVRGRIWTSAPPQAGRYRHPVGFFD
jgi:hypothetical protein